MSERIERNIRLKFLKDLVEEENRVRKEMVASGALFVASGALSFVHPVFIPPTVLFCAKLRKKTREHDEIERKQRFLREKIDGQ